VKTFRAETSAHYDEAKKLFEAYARSLDFDLEFQGFDQELARFPGDYAPPRGAVLLATLDDEVVGCVALRPLEGDTCEMKRLYVTPEGRGHGVGRRLVAEIVDEARRIGYAAMRLDTVPSMQAARRLYAAFGFEPIEAYRYNPIPGTSFMELKLRS